MDNIKQFLEADALLQAARGDDYGKAYIVMRDAAMDIAPDIRQLLAAFEQVCEALERAKWDIVSCGILVSRKTIHEDAEAHDEILHYVNQIEQHQIPAKERIQAALTAAAPYRKLMGD